MEWIARNGMPNPGDTDSDVVFNLTPLRGTYANYFTGANFEKVANSIPPGLTGLAREIPQTIHGKGATGTASYAALVTGLAALRANVTGMNPAGNQALKDITSILEHAAYIRWRGYGVTLYTLAFIGSDSF